MGGEECGLTRGLWKSQQTEGWPVCTSHRGGQATVELPRVRPSLPHLSVSPPGLGTQEMSWNGCLQPAGAKPWGLGGGGFCGDSSTGGVWTGRPRAPTLSSSKWAGRASRTGTGPREGWWRKRCLCRLQSAVGVETLRVFSEGAWHAGRGQGAPRTDG